MNTPSVVRRVAPAIGLFLLAPIVAEYLLGDIPISMLYALVLLAPMYGGGALLIREVTRRAGRGVPTMLFLGLAYGVLEEGLTTQSLFNPDYAGERLLDSAFVPALGIGGSWTVFVLTLHAVWSTTVPILLMEAVVPSRRTTPWLGRVGLTVTSVLFVAGAVVTAVQQRAQYPYAATAAQLAACALVVVVLVVLALRLPRRATGEQGTVLAPWVLGVLALALGSAFFVLSMGSGWTGVAVTLAVDVAVAVLVARWSGRTAWTPTHTLATAAGTVLVYAWQAFTKPILVPTPPAMEMLSHVVFAALAVAVIAAGVLRTRKAARPAQREPAHA